MPRRNLMGFIRSQILGRPLSSEDMEEQGLTHILKYSEAARCKTISQLFGGKNHCLLLLPTVNEEDGHWVLLLRHKNVVEYFDPYGKPMGHWVPMDELEDLFQGSNLVGSQHFVYNTFAFQAQKNSISTCGRWCLMRFIQNDLSLQQFTQCFGEANYSLTRDELISLLI
jgi:hypothetical protein